MVKKYTSLRNLIQLKRWRKANFCDEHRRKVRQKKAEKRIIRKYQSKHNGRLPDLTDIPDGFYCVHYKQIPLQNGEFRRCPYYSEIKFKEAEILYGIEALEEFEDDPHIGRGCCAGACSLLMTNDYLQGPWSMLWDELKSCCFNPEPHK